MLNRSESLSIIFPCYNDAGTIASLVVKADAVGRSLTDDYEIIVVDDGSTDGSAFVLEELVKRYPLLRIIRHDCNRGYGAAVRAGIGASTKKWIFYTDGDGQYDAGELRALAEKACDDVDIVNGFKIKRHDPVYRIVIGWLYQRAMGFAFGLSIRDVDCDFRLLRRSVVGSIPLRHTTGVICVELIAKLEHAGARFAEVGVHHYFRSYGKSTAFQAGRIAAAGVRLFRLWIALRLFHRYTAD